MNFSRHGSRLLTTFKRLHSHDVAYVPSYRLKIGNREVVGPCATGIEEYFDRTDIPLPPIRFKAPSPAINALREKEKGDWKKLTTDEKKLLYRSSFCQTFAEIEAPTPEGKRIAGNVMLLMCAPLLLFMILKLTIFPPLPYSMSDEGKKRVVRFYIDNRADPIDGISSKWDYEKNEWKERPYLLMKNK